MALALHLKLRQLEPILAGLPRSDERLFWSPAPRYIGAPQGLCAKQR
jgi:hypothetical protein